MSSGQNDKPADNGIPGNGTEKTCAKCRKTIRKGELWYRCQNENHTGKVVCDACKIFLHDISIVCTNEECTKKGVKGLVRVSPR